MQLKSLFAEPCSPADLLVKLLHSTQLQQVAELVGAASTAMCGQLPVSRLCNNPDCVNLEGASELQLVGGRSCVCGRCKVAR